MPLSTFLRWAMTVWIFGDIHMCGVASLIVRKLWGVTQIWLMFFVRLWKTFRTAFSVCLYRLFEVSYGCLNIWGLYHRCEVASLIVRKLWGVTQIWLMILVRLWKTFRTTFSVCLYRLFDVSYGCLNIWGLYNRCEIASLILRKLWGVTQIWLKILVRLWKTFRTPFSLCLYRLFEVSYGCLNIWGLYNRCEIASLIVRKLWYVTQIWLMILVRLWKSFRTAFSVCLYRLFEVSYGCLNIWWYTHVWSCLTNCEKTVRCDADLIDDSCEALKDLSNGVFRMSLSTFWGELWLFEYMGVISQVWSCLTNCEKTVRCDADLIDDSCEASKVLSNGVLRMSLSTFWGELWLFEYMGVISQVWNCLTNCEKTVRCDADLIDDSCESLEGLSNAVFRMSLSTFWGELWLFEYMIIYTGLTLPH